MSISKITFNDNQEACIVVDPISEIDKSDFKTYLDLDSPSFLKCEFENDKAFTLYYNVGSRITLKQFLSRVVMKSEVIGFLKSLTQAYINAVESGLNTDHIPLGINSIFYDTENAQVSCVYVPVVDGIMPPRPLRVFIKEMLVNMVYSEEDNMEWLGNVIRYISRNRNLSYNEFYEFLQSQEDKDNESDVNIEAEMEEEKTDEATPVLENIPAAESVDALKAETEDADASEDESVETMTEDEADAEEYAPEETVEEVPEEIGVIIRRSNHETFELKEAEIRIGKSADNEICINDNPAISRVHAVITQFDGTYAIQDNDSTNHTFVNGIVLEENREKILASGDRILLGNEELIFKIQNK
ncbi:MAG: FHA domain-containing protein [Lachnospiraceae bacterium]|nr:FHA domain-containing protein [Lachnospiraceae bacterium]